MDTLDRRQFSSALQLHQAECIDRKDAPTCELCGIEKATAATMDKELGLVENVCPTCQNEELEVVVLYI